MRLEENKMSVPENAPSPKPGEPATAATSVPAATTTVSPDLLIPVVAHARVTAWPPNLQQDEGGYVTLTQVLVDAYRCDAHFAAYSRPDKPPRLKNDALPLLGDNSGVTMVLMVFDVDCEKAHSTKQPASDSWFAAECKKLDRLDTTWPGIFVARSKGGYRIVYRLAKLFPICDDDAKSAWTLYYRGCCAYLAREFGIVADPACADWTRLYRVPHATRDPEIGPEERDVRGDPHNVGVWGYFPMGDSLDADIAAASTVAKDSKAWRERVLNPLLRRKRELEGMPPHTPKRAAAAPTTRTSGAMPSTGAGVAETANDPTTQAAWAWLSKYPPAVEGCGGDAVTYKAALRLVKGFRLPLPVALDLLERAYNPRCTPPWSKHALEHKVKCAQNAPGPAGYCLQQTDKTAIVITTAEHEVVDQAEAALAAKGCFYQRAGMLVHVVRDDRPRVVDHGGAVLRPPHVPRVIDVSVPHLREELTRVAALQSRNDKGDLQAVHPPKWLPEALNARGHWRGVPHLEGVVETPILRPDGSVLQEAGYDLSTGVLFEPNDIFLPVHDAPTQAEAKKAADDLLEVFSDFPLVGPEHQSAALAGVLTAFAQHCFDGPSPLVAIDAPAAGTGKGLFVDAISTITTGRVMSRMSHASNEEEERKRITSIALAGDRQVLIDNVTRPLGSGTLDAALTAEEWRDRILGQNKVVTLRLRVIWFLTANNLQIIGDTARRILNIRMDAKMERPEQRTAFKHPRLLEWIRRERPRLVHAALTILRAFFVAGAPEGPSDWGSFEGWSRVVRGAILFVGLKDPAETRNALSGRADTETAALTSVFDGLEALCAGNSLEAVEIVDAIHTKSRTHGRLHAALLELRPLRGGQPLDAQALGYTLRKFRDRVVGGRRLASERSGDRHRWYIEHIGAPGASSPPSVSEPLRRPTVDDTGGDQGPDAPAHA